MSATGRAEDEFYDARRRVADLVLASDRLLAVLVAIGRDEFDRPQNRFRIESGNRDVARVHRFGPLDRAPHRDGGETEDRRLFADRAAVREGTERVGLQSQVVVVPERRQEMDVWVAAELKRFEALPRARVSTDDNRPAVIAAEPV